MLLADVLRLDCNTAADIFLEKYFAQLNATNDINANCHIAPSHIQNKEQLAQLVSLLRRCPVGAEIAANLLTRIK